MRLHPISALSRTIAAAGVLLASAFADLNAQVVADFSGGTGTSLPDQYVGKEGDGWTRSWYSLMSSGNITLNGVVTDSNPLKSGGNYLQVTTGQTGGNGSQQNTSLGRRYTNHGEVDTTKEHVISFDLRIDSWTIGSVNPGSQFIGIYGNTTASMGNNFTSSSTWMIRVFAGETGNASALTWAAYDGNRDGGSYNTGNLQDIGSGLAFRLGVTYSFTIINNPITGSYKVTVADGETTVSTSEWLGYRTSNWGEDYSDDLWTVWHEQTLNQSDGATFSIDNIHINAIPEPGTLSLVGLVLVGSVFSRRLLRRRS